MWKKLMILLGITKQEAKEKLKNHPHHQGCDFGVKEFNKNKRNREFVEELNKKGHGNPHTGGGTEPPPPPPPTTSTDTGIVLVVFNGITVSGTSWNTSGDIICAYSGLSLEEQQSILNWMQGDYTGFNILFTADEARYNAAPTTRRSKLVFTESWEWYGQAGGTSFINSFGTTNGVSFIFSSLLGYNLKFNSEAGSHECGHQMGLRHQSVYNSSCQKTAEYNYGGDGVAPIMGCAYYQPDGKWWNGPSSSGCTIIQDDVSILKAKLG